MQLKIWSNIAKSGKNLTFDLLPPANKNFWKYGTWPSLSPYLVLKSCEILKKSNEAFLRYFQKTSFLCSKWTKTGAWSQVRIFVKNLAISLFLLYWCLTLCKISEKSYERFCRFCVTDQLTDRQTNGTEIIAPFC